MALVDVAASIAATPVLVEVGVPVPVFRCVRERLVDFLLDGRELVHRSIRSTA
jgi:hypothetical protein